MAPDRIDKIRIDKAGFTKLSCSMNDEAWLEVKRRRGVVRQVADGLGITTSAVSQWQRVPSDRVAAVAKLLDMSTRALRPDLHREASAAARPSVDSSIETTATATIRIETELLRQADAHGIDLSAIAAEALREKLAVLRRERWLAENQGAFEDSHRLLEKYGLWSDGLRQF